MSSSAGMPGARDGEVRPRLDEHLVQDETREEMVHGRKVVALPAKPPHADRHVQVDYLVSAYLKADYVPATDLLTRVSIDSEFATDTCVRRAGIDPETNTRYLEELAFEVVSTQSLRDITERAELLSARGVRRLMAIFVKRAEVCEWSAVEHRWVSLPIDGVIDDPVFAQPMPVRPLLDAAVADDAVAEALLAKRNPRLVRHEDAVRERAFGEGRLEARHETLVLAIGTLCEVLGILVGPSERAQMLALDVAGLEALLNQIKIDRRWPN